MEKILLVMIIVLILLFPSSFAVHKLSSDNIELKNTNSYIMNDPPYKPNIYGPSNGSAYVEYTFCTDAITDPEKNQFYCFWDWGDGNSSGWVGPYASGETMCASYKWTEAGVYYIRLKLKDDDGWESEWSDTFEITIFENHPPDKPIIYYEHGFVPLVEFDYYFNATDPDGDNIRFIISWGDGYAELSDFVKSGEVITVGHTYFLLGTLMISAYAEDIHNARGPEGKKILWGNWPPDVMFIKGPMFPKSGESYSWTFNAFDPDHDNVSYYIDWGDGHVTNWTKYYPSEISIQFNHTFYGKHVAWIRAKAKDIYDYESDWKYLWPFPKGKNVNFNSLLLNQLEKYPILQKIIKRIGVH